MAAQDFSVREDSESLVAHRFVVKETRAGVPDKSTFTVPGLQTGTRVWFRVVAVNANGQSPRSDPVTKIVP